MYCGGFLRLVSESQESRVALGSDSPRILAQLASTSYVTWTSHFPSLSLVSSTMELVGGLELGMGIHLGTALGTEETPSEWSMYHQQPNGRQK